MTGMNERDYYAVLNVSPSCEFQELKKAYYRRAMDCHPDRHGGNPAREEEFKQLVEAFNVLSDPMQRARFDAARPRPPKEPPPAAPRFAVQQEDAILDSFADDILEEMIVGNTVPLRTTLQTLMLDLQNTERFCMLREGKNLFYGGRVGAAAHVFAQYVQFAPDNILAHYFLGRSHLLCGRPRRALREYAEAIRVGAARQPPLRLVRIRREARYVFRQKLGPISRLRYAHLLSWTPNESLPDDELMRRAVGRALARYLQQDRRRLGE